VHRPSALDEKQGKQEPENSERGEGWKGTEDIGDDGDLVLWLALGRRWWEVTGGDRAGKGWAWKGGARKGIGEDQNVGGVEAGHAHRRRSGRTRRGTVWTLEP
jgi:hypothetical protein